MREAQEASGIRVAFSLVYFFWRSKRKKLAFGCENPIKAIRRISDTKHKTPTNAITQYPQ